MSDLITQRTDLDDGLCVAVTGDIDLSRAPELRAGLLELIQHSPMRLVVDLENVGYMDSSGVATLVEVFQRQRKHNGVMVLAAMQPKVRSIFEIARLDSVFTIVDDTEAAKTA